MLIFAEAQLTLVASLALLVFLDIRKRALYSACVLGALLAYALYYLAIDYTDTFAQVPAMASHTAFVEVNLTVLALFAAFFQLGRMLVAVVASRFRFRTPSPASSWRRSPGWAILAPLMIGAVLVAITADGWWLFTQYPHNKNQFAIVSLGGAGAMANLLILLGVQQARLARKYVPIAYGVFGLVSVHYLLAGDRGSFIFVGVGLYALRLQSHKSFNLRRALELLAVSFATLVLLDTVSQLRSHQYGRVQTQEVSFLEELDLLPQAVAHMIHALSISATGAPAYAGGTLQFLLQLLLQIVPSQILTALGIPLYNGPWLLASFVKHGGGFFVPAELVFAGGFLTLSLVALYFGVMASINNRIGQRAREGRDALMTMVVLIAAAANFYTFFYGVQAMNRMVTLPVTLLILRHFMKVVLGWRKRRRRVPPAGTWHRASGPSITHPNKRGLP